MGGDDLGSDDEIWARDLSAPLSGRGSEEDDADDVGGSLRLENTRKRSIEQTVGESSESPKTKKRQSPEALLVEAGRRIEEQSAEQQAAFLTAAVQHYTLLHDSSSSVDSSFTLGPQHFLVSSKETLGERVKDVVSMSKLRKWKTPGSPCVVVLCISARRAVAVLKEVSFLKTRVAKLFPKNGSAEEQKDLCRNVPLGICVGTPHRVAVLSGCFDGGDASLSFDRTELVIFDSHLSNKQFSVVR